MREIEKLTESKIVSASAPRAVSAWPIQQSRLPGIETYDKPFVQVKGIKKSLLHSLPSS
jgi:hypothetical protein